MKKLPRFGHKLLILRVTVVLRENMPYKLPRFGQMPATYDE